MSSPFEVITYEDTMVFKYSLSEQEPQEQIERDVTLVWEEPLEKFLESFGSEKPYEVHSFKNEREKNLFITSIEDRTDEIIDEVDEEISQKMKFSHVYTSPTYED